MRYKHALIIYELDSVLADCSVREAAAEAAGPRHGKGSSAYWEVLFDSRHLKHDLLVEGGRELTRQLWKDNMHQVVLTRRPLAFPLHSPFHNVYLTTITWCFEQDLMPGWFRAWIFREQRVQSSEALWKQEQVCRYVEKHPEVDHLYVVDNDAENRYAIGSLCIDLYLGMDLLGDIRALEATLERDRKV
jgi:hypothetical protein